MRCRTLYAAALLLALSSGACVALPAAQAESNETRVSLEQGWSAADRDLFYHQTQGSVVLPYEWFLALEQPEVKFVGTVALFRDPEYLSRFGFLADVTPVDAAGTAVRIKHCQPKVAPGMTPADPAYNCGLPVGLARATVTMPDSGEREDVVGFTCAACHTSELRHGGLAIRIEGASNSLDVTQFQDALGGALILTQRFPFRFNRFADRVLKSRGLETDSPDYDIQRTELRNAFAAFMSSSASEMLTAQRKRLYANHPGGFGRTDALARIGNMIFGTEMENDGNLAVASAPVKFPSIWDAPYFSWAQYNGSIEQSMVRNVGEALGVRARVGFARGGRQWGTSGEREDVLTSTVDIPGLFSIETLLRGNGRDYFSGLRSPVWPEAYLGEIAWDRANRGRQLYQTHCQGCHLPPLADLVKVVDVPPARARLRGPGRSPLNGDRDDGHGRRKRQTADGVDRQQPPVHARQSQDHAVRADRVLPEPRHRGPRIDPHRSRSGDELCEGGDRHGLDPAAELSAIQQRSERVPRSNGASRRRTADGHHQPDDAVLRPRGRADSRRTRGVRP